MAGLLSHRILGVLWIGCCFIWLLHAAENTPLPDTSDKQNLFFHRYKQSRKSIDLNLEQAPLRPPSSNTEERSVILPRLCYFARVSGTSLRHKLCLPYDDR